MRRTRFNKSDSQLTLNNLFLQTRTKQLRNLCADSTRENSPVQNKAAVSRWPAQALHARNEHEVRRIRFDAQGEQLEKTM